MICATVLGHVFSGMARLQGRQGRRHRGRRASALPMAGGLVACGTTWLLVAAVTRYSSLAAIVAAILAPLFTWLATHEARPTIAVALVVLLILERHRGNSAAPYARRGKPHRSALGRHDRTAPSIRLSGSIGCGSSAARMSGRSRSINCWRASGRQRRRSMRCPSSRAAPAVSVRSRSHPRPPSSASLPPCATRAPNSSPGASRFIPRRSPPRRRAAARFGARQSRSPHAPRRRHRGGAQRIGQLGAASRSDIASRSGRAGNSSSCRASRAASTPRRMKARSPGGTVAVLAGGIDVVYPPENQALYERIAQTGRDRFRDAARPGAAGAPLPAPQSHHLRPVARRGGGRSGGKFGLADHRELRARTGPRDLRRARLAARSAREGTNRLIREGATLTESAEDVLAVLAPILGQLSASRRRARRAARRSTRRIEAEADRVRSAVEEKSGRRPRRGRRTDPPDAARRPPRC